ncbi:MAG: IS1380 family transposase [Tepidisphaerales bacterium]
MKTECSPTDLLFQDLGSREVVGRFDGGPVTSDGGGLLLREVEAQFHFIDQFARCFTDHRDPDLVEHPLTDLLKQRIFGLCLGYEDLIDHDRLRHDPLLAVLVGKNDPQGQQRVRPQDKGKALAGKSTLNRLELTPVRANAGSRYKKTVAHLDAMQRFFVDAFVQQYLVPPQRLVLDLDSTDFPLYGHQLGRFFHGYYDEYCYLPLYIFCGDHPLLALLRPADIDGAAGALKHLARIVARIRECWPGVRIVVRGDSGFCREHLMRWCEDAGVDYLFGLAKNKRLLALLEPELQQAKEGFAQSGQAARVFKDFRYSTLDSWSRERRVVGKAEHLAKGSNPRFVVTSLSPDEIAAQPLYEREYCHRGEMENRIKEQQRMLFANRVSCSTMRANQLRLCLATVAYIVLRALRQFGLERTEMAAAQCDTIRVKLLKIGAVVRVTVRRVWVALSEAYPLREVFVQVWERLHSLNASPRPAVAETG